MKKIISLCVSLVILFAFTCSTAFAAEANVMRTEIPEDAVILYQDDTVTVYRSDSQAQADGINSTRSMDYAYAWVNATDNQYGSFDIDKTFSGTGHITMKVESSNGGAYAQMTLKKGSNYITTATPYASNPDGVVLNTTISTKGTYTIEYLCYNNTSGMRLLCWIYG